MGQRRYVNWGEVGAEVQCTLWREALERAHGNITRAATTMKFSKRHGMRLTKEHDLGAYAAELRKKATGQSKGRPW